MTDALTMFEPIPFELTAEDYRLIGAGLVQYVKRLRKVAGELRKDTGKAEDADRYESEASAIESQLIDTDEIDLSMYHIPVVRAGLERLAVILRAGQGSTEAWARPKWKEQLKVDVKHIEQTLLPAFSDQKELPLDEPQPDSGD